MASGGSAFAASQAGLSGYGEVDGVPGRRQVGAQQVCGVGVVLDDEYAAAASARILMDSSRTGRAATR